MKRLAIALVTIFMAVSAFAQLSTAQKALRSDIKAFLEQEGYVPSIDSDGDLQFKVEGKPYYVSISETDSSPMYIRLSRYFNYPEDYSRLVVKVAAAELSLYKTVKVLCLDQSLVLQTEMYVQEPEAFKYAFYKMVSQLQSACDDINSELQNAQREVSQSL